MQEDLRAGAGEVQSECRHVAAEIADAEDQVVGERGDVPPNDPTEPRVDEAVLVSRCIDRGDALDAEVPFQIRLQEGSDHGTRRAVNVDGHVDSGGLLDAIESRGDGRDGLVHPCVGDAQDRDNADSVLVDILLEAVTVENLMFLGDGNIPWFDLEVVAEFLPAHLHRAGEHDVRLLGGFSSTAARMLPAALEGEAT